MSHLNNFDRVAVATRSLILFFAIGCLHFACAHPAPNSLVLLDIRRSAVSIELQLPLVELQSAFGTTTTFERTTMVEKYGDLIKMYLQSHIKVLSADSTVWLLGIDSMTVLAEQKLASGGTLDVLKINLKTQPPFGGSTRQFILQYDVIIHQVINHNALVSIRQDWLTGVYAEKPMQVGVICLDIPKNIIPPFPVNLQAGSVLAGFKSMLDLGIKHISGGTDHLLFLLTLLLVAPLTIQAKRWSHSGGIKYSLTRLIKIITAFTIGHSLTLLLGSIGWVHFPSKPIEILIALSILISAIHAIKPIFFGREMYIAMGFGLIHGLAFAGTLVGLQLSPQYLLVSVLGFNIGIELMQLFIVALVMPLLIILSSTPTYNYVRIFGAIFSLIAAIDWIVERISDTPNPMTEFLKVFVFKF